MKDKIFLDTNILIYQFSSDEFKKNIAISIVEDFLKSGNYVISYQVIQEFSNIALNKHQIYFSHSQLKTYIEDILIPLCKFYPSPKFYLDSLKLKNKYNFSYYDSLIVSAAIEMNCKFLYSEDFLHNQKIGSLKILNPFIH